MAKHKKKLRHKLFPFALLFIGSAFGFFNYIQYLNYKRVCAQADEILSQIEKENERHKKLQEQIKTYDSDEYVEHIARTQLGMVKSDEIIFYQDSEEE